VFNQKFKTAGKSVTAQLYIVTIFILVSIDSQSALQNFFLFVCLA